MNLAVGEDAFIGSEKAAPELDGPAWKEQDSYPLEILEYLDWVGHPNMFYHSLVCPPLFIRGNCITLTDNHIHLHILSTV